MTANDIKKILLIGSGTMGQQIAGQCALFGKECLIHTLNDQERQRAVKGIRESVLAPIVKAGMAPPNRRMRP